MAVSLQAYFQPLFSRIPGLKAVLISDRDGVTLQKVTATEGDTSAVEPLVVVTFAVAAEQIFKCGMGRMHTSAIYTDTTILLLLSCPPLVVTFVGSPSLNLGLLQQLVPSMKVALEPLCAAVEQEINL
eukprot:CAMPEP_0177667214 /NCGR_PEP_ID=MMETSP0447-20121125/21999_1 /TAXON_ID=0 /ORGANISM="Stygamoeba regulata, Strain BSH-02190019" /LENGTH=127 /DNA_ID=CAMNT_0019173421 /DNA_START=228 /DNA_END=611 /DNA_ORIENTATION=+